MISSFARLVRRTAAGVAAMMLVTVATGCTSETDTPEPAPSPLPGASTGAAPTLEARPVPMQVRVTRVSGKLRKASRASLERNVARTVGAYFEDAYLGGTYPRDDFGAAFATFSDGAARRARHDLGFLTNARLGPSTQAVAPREKKAWLSVLAPHRVAAGVTARVRLVYVVDRGDAVDQEVTVSGRLLLSRRASGGWQVFGYDISRATRPAEQGSSS